MKLKFINCLLAAAISVGAAQVFTSCKDTNEDMFAQLEDELVSIQKKHDADILVVKGLITDLEGRTTTLEGKVQDLEDHMVDYVKKTDFNTFVDNYIKAVSDYNNLSDVLNNLKSVYDEVQAAHGEYANLNARFLALETALQSAQATLGVVEGWQSALEGANTSFDDLIMAAAQAQQNAADIAAINQVLETLQNCQCGEAKDWTEKINELEGKINALPTQADVDQVKTDLEQAVETAKSDVIQQLQGETASTIQDVQDTIEETVIPDINDLKTRVQDAEEAIEDIIDRVTALENRISSIMIQGTKNPVLGYLATPFGINSNVLMAYAGTSSHSIDMPNADPTYEYDGATVFTAGDIAFLAPSFTNIPSGSAYISDADANLGRLYLTLNPANIDLDGKTFQLVNSQDKVSYAELKNLRPCDELLTFGYSRADNGFYVADVTIPANNNMIGSIMPNINSSDLKSAAKQILDNRDKSSIINLGRALYEQVNGILPAMGVKASWDENGAQQAVYSNYNLAVTAVTPLSYKFAYGRSFRQIHLPNLDNFEFNINADGVNIDLPSITIDFSDVAGDMKVDFDLGITIDNLGTITATVMIPTTGEIVGDEIVLTDYQPAEGTADLTQVTAKLNEALHKAFYGDGEGQEGINDKLEASIQDALTVIQDRLQTSIDNMMKDMSSDVNDALNDVINNLQQQVNNKISDFKDLVVDNPLYDYLQRAINRANKALADPNHYLQSVLLFQNNGKYGFVSTAKGMPSQFVVKGGNASTLMATTYTGETVTPAFKKFIAVTNVYKTGDMSVNAQAGDATCRSLAEKANSQQYCNEVIDGRIRTIPFYFEGGQGYTYEIVYQALDYEGVTSTNKYYISVK